MLVVFDIIFLTKGGLVSVECWIIREAWNQDKLPTVIYPSSREVYIWKVDPFRNNQMENIKNSRNQRLTRTFNEVEVRQLIQDSFKPHLIIFFPTHRPPKTQVWFPCWGMGSQRWPSLGKGHPGIRTRRRITLIYERIFESRSVI